MGNAAKRPICQVEAVHASQHEHNENDLGVAYKIAWCVFLEFRANRSFAQIPRNGAMPWRQRHCNDSANLHG
jgi:hypothetical protein